MSSLIEVAPRHLRKLSGIQLHLCRPLAASDTKHERVHHDAFSGFHWRSPPFRGHQTPPTPVQFAMEDLSDDEQLQLAIAMSLSEPVEPPRKRQRREPPSQTIHPTHLLSMDGGPIYGKGVIKRTWASSHARTKHDITIDEVLQRNLLRKAALSSFQWDTDWLWSKLDLTKTDIMVIMQGKTEYDRHEITEDAKAYNPRIKVCFPPMPGQVNCMHSKFMLLFYDAYMRIAIPTANLTVYDWGDDGRMENSVFLVDLPELTTGPKHSVEDLTFFGKELHHFLSRMEVPDHLLNALLRYDFTQTAHLAFVHTIGNASQLDSDKDRTGYPGLSRAVRELGLETDSLQLDFAVSSIGALKDDFLNAFYASSKGCKTESTATVKHKNTPNGYKDNLRAYFPTDETVMKSLAGSAGTICFQRRWYNEPSFPKDILRDYKSTRSGLLSHNKILLARGARQHAAGDDVKSQAVAWAYVGSHNLSESAWGRVTINKSKKEASINCKNWECGVLMPVEVGDKVGQDGLPTDDVFVDSLEIPFEFPGAHYDGKQPWFFNS